MVQIAFAHAARRKRFLLAIDFDVDVYDEDDKTISDEKALDLGIFSI